jgi:PEGA domain
MPSVTAEIKLSVDPDRAAVFVDGLLVGHAGELGGIGKSLLVAPGKRKITISLPGYQSFETEVELAPNQKFTLKTKLLKTAATQESPPSQ